MFKWLKRYNHLHNHHESHTISSEDLDHSLNLLSTTAVEVSKEAVNAAKVLNRQLQDSEYRFFSTIDVIDDLVIIKSGDGRWKTLNKWGQDFFGWLHGEYIGKTDRELIILYPRLEDFLKSSLWTDSVAWEHQKPHRVRERIPSIGDREDFYFDTVKTPIFNEDGQKKELIIIARDITEIKNRSKRIKACFHALNSASDIIFIVDSDGCMFFCNDMFLKKFSYNDYNEVVGQNINIILPDVLKCRDMWKTILDNKTWEGQYDEEYNITVLPMMNGTPKPIFYICTLKAKKTVFDK